MKFRVSLLAGWVAGSHATLSLPAAAQDVDAAAASPSTDEATPTGPAVVPAPAPTHPSMVSVHMVALEPNLRFIVRASEQANATLGKPLVTCTAPCEAQLPPGEYRVALSRNGGKGVDSVDPIVLLGPTTLLGTYESHAGDRVLGIALMLAGVVGAVLSVDAFSHPTCSGPFCASQPDPGLGIVGALLIGVGGVGIWQLGHPDKIRVDFLHDSARRDDARSDVRRPSALRISRGAGPGLGVEF
jgi:hypothetical protein